MHADTDVTHLIIGHREVVISSIKSPLKRTNLTRIIKRRKAPRKLEIYWSIPRAFTTKLCGCRT